MYGDIEKPELGGGRLDRLVERTIEAQGLDNIRDINWVDHPGLRMALTQREYDHAMNEPLVVMPASWDGHRRLREDDYPVYEPDSPSFEDWLVVDGEPIPPWLAEEGAS